MSNEDNKEKKSHTGLIAGLSAALAAGAMYFYGPQGERRRKNFHGWMLKTKGEVLEKLEEAESVTKERYEEIVDEAIAKYAAEKAKKKEEVEILRAELKTEWGSIKERVEEKSEELRSAAAEEIAVQSKKLIDSIAPDEK